MYSIKIKLLAPNLFKHTLRLLRLLLLFIMLILTRFAPLKWNDHSFKKLIFFMHVTHAHWMQVNNTEGCVVKISASLQLRSSINFFVSLQLYFFLLLKSWGGCLKKTFLFYVQHPILFLSLAQISCLFVAIIYKLSASWVMGYSLSCCILSIQHSAMYLSTWYNRYLLNK